MITAPRLAGIVIEEDHQGRALGITWIGRDLQEAQGEPCPPINREAQRSIFVGFKKRHKFAALNQCLGPPACPHGKHPAGGADIALWADQDGHDTRFAQPLSGGP